MNGVRTVGVAVLAVLALSCSTAPVKIKAGDNCYGCRRPIRNARFAAESISGDRTRFVSKFRGPACMARYLVNHPGEEGVIYVTDFESGNMMKPGKAHFVSELVDQDTGEREYRAYSDQGLAQAAAAELKTTVVSWEQVLDQAR